MTLHCVFCALSVPYSREAVLTPVDDKSAVFIVNGQSCCYLHSDIPYRFPDHGLGGMIARQRAYDFESARNQERTN